MMPDDIHSSDSLTQSEYSIAGSGPPPSMPPPISVTICKLCGDDMQLGSRYQGDHQVQGVYQSLHNWGANESNEQ